MSWIKEYSKSASSLFKGQVLDGMQPLDFFHFFPLWYDLWVANVVRAINQLNIESKKFNDIKDILPVPSSLRAILIKLITAYYGHPAKNKSDYKIVANFIARLLKESCPEDPFALKSNPFHTESDIDILLKNIKLTEASPVNARKIGQLITSAGSLVHGLYNDVVTDFGWDAYGPYNIESNQTLLIRHFSNLQPKDLWSDYTASVKELFIYSIYEDVDWEISFLGCHTISKGQSPINGMKKFAIQADGIFLDENEINILIDELSIKATQIYQEIRKIEFEELKLMVMRQECYQFKKLFDKAKIDWEPTDEMTALVKDKPLLKNIFPHGKLIESTEDFKEVFGINKFEKEVLDN
ncbi:MAG: hypothetical protein Q8P20_10140 [bacterium]|nr:hypothetical protein [bacterium]